MINADGSATTTINRYSLGALANTEVTTESANGLVVTRRRDEDGNGVFDQTRTDTTVVNADGTETRTITTTKTGGMLISKSVSTLSADGRTMTVAEDNDGFERTTVESAARLADGSEVTTVKIGDGSGKLKSAATTTVSADGKTVSSSRNSNGDGTADQVEVSTAHVDGSSSVLITGYAAGVKNNQTIVSASADHLRTVTGWDVAGDGTFERKSIAVNTVNADGSLSQVTSSYSTSFATSVNTNTLLRALESSANGTLLSRRTTTTSADGKTSTVQEDLNGDGVIDRTIISVVDITGAVTTTTTNTAEGRKIDYVLQSAPIWGSIYGGAAALTSTRSADDLSETILADYDGDGVNEYIEVAQRRMDGSVVSAIVETDWRRRLGAKRSARMA